MCEADGVVFVVDDDASMRDAVDSLFRSVGVRCLGFCSAKEFLSDAPRDVLACLVLDVRLPGTNGLDLQHYLAEHQPYLPIIFVSAHGDIRMTVKAMKAGAIEFLPKPFQDQELLDAVQRALEAARLARQSRARLDAIEARFRLLTPRERQVLELMVKGLLNKQIGAELGIREATVKIHRGHIMHKTRATSLPQLVRWAERVGLGNSGY